MEAKNLAAVEVGVVAPPPKEKLSVWKWVVNACPIINVNVLSNLKDITERSLI